MAVALHGHLRATEDLDILVDTEPENLRRLLAVLAEFGSGEAAKELCVEDFAKEEGAIRVVEDFPVDIFTVMRGIDYARAAQTRQIHPHPGGDIPYLSSETLQFLKSQSMREKDLWDVWALRKLEAAKKP